MCLSGTLQRLHTPRLFHRVTILTVASRPRTVTHPSRPVEKLIVENIIAMASAIAHRTLHTGAEIKRAHRRAVSWVQPFVHSDSSAAGQPIVRSNDLTWVVNRTRACCHQCMCEGEYVITLPARCVKKLRKLVLQKLQCLLASSWYAM